MIFFMKNRNYIAILSFCAIVCTQVEKDICASSSVAQW